MNVKFEQQKEIFHAAFQKCLEISQLKTRGNFLLEDLDYISFDMVGVHIHTSYSSWGSTDYEYVEFTWEQLDNPIEYFVKYFSDLADAEEKRKKDLELRNKEDARQQEWKKYIELKAKFEGNE